MVTCEDVISVISDLCNPCRWFSAQRDDKVKDLQFHKYLQMNGVMTTTMQPVILNMKVEDYRGIDVAMTCHFVVLSRKFMLKVVSTETYSNI